MVDFSLDERVAIVTGAAVGGIGEAYVHALADAGAAVVCADINEAGAAGVADAVVGKGGRALAVGVDITDDASVDAMARAAVAEFGGIDILVNNAALMVPLVVASYSEHGGATTLEFPSELWDAAFDVNVKGSWRCARAVVPMMRERGGAIVNQASIGALPAESVYGITKLAVIGLTTALARELGPAGITVNCIAPGSTQSEAGKVLTPEGSPYREAMEQRAALRATGDPDELCGALLLLVSPAGRWMTGQMLVVDGGICLHV
jgi:NAD(P)-dependent dehydrogenase (short-subunit alcohol dehydrogenase family)